MKQINLRLPDDVHESLKRLAQRERRSINAMIVVLIERAGQADLPDSPPT
jgi:hypothetical protein